MKENFTVFAVDDDPLVLDVIHGVLDPVFGIETFTSSEACLSRLESGRPDLFLLDVRMPGMDGYALCRRLKDDPAFAATPVTFISSKDTIQARLEGYDAGGDDFIVKPFVAEELVRKVKVAQQIVASTHRYRQQLDDSEMLSSLILANMDEYALLVRFLRELVGMGSEEAVALGVLDLARRFNLDAVVQVRGPGTTLTQGTRERNLPLEESIIAHVRSLDRIFEFGNRSVHNFERITLLISNMPVHDPDTCGRLRDHLCIAMESAEGRLRALETEAANRRNERGLHGALRRIQAITRDLAEAHLRDSVASSDLIFRLEQGLSKSYVRLGLTEEQERDLGETISGFVQELLHLQDRSELTHRPLIDLSNELGALLHPAAGAPPPEAPLSRPAAAAPA